MTRRLSDEAGRPDRARAYAWMIGAVLACLPQRGTLTGYEAAPDAVLADFPVLE